MRRRVERETEGLRMLSASEERVESEGDIALNEKQKKKKIESCAHLSINLSK